MASITNVKVGVCEVTFNDVAMGHTKGGTEVSYEPVYHDVTVDKYGETVVEKYLVGEKLTAKVIFAESTIANFKKVMPMGTLAGAGDARITLGADSGKKASDNAYELVLHPQNEGTRAYDVVIHKAFASSPVMLPFLVDGERVYEVTFEGLLDESKSDGNYLGLIGDSSV